MILFRSLFRAVSVLSMLALLLVSYPGISTAASRPSRSAKKVLAFYYTWYGAPAVTGGWRHWNEGGHDPDHKNPAGLPDIGATDHPPALYDSNDLATIRRHLREARSAGIDGLIATWWGQGDWHDNAFQKVLGEAEAELKANSRPIFLSIYYEQSPPNAADPVAAVAGDFDYLLERYGKSPAFYRYRGKPVLFVYGRAVGELTREQWKAALARVKAKHDVYVVGDSTDPSWYSVFDSLHEYNPVGAVKGGEDMRARYRKLTKDARENRRVPIVTVIPGYDDSHIGRLQPIVAPRDKGRLYLRLWNAALDASPDWTLITTFNEWHEGSEIEPSVEYGDLFLRRTSVFSRFFRSDQSLIAANESGPDAPKGWKVRAGHGSRLSFRTLPGGGISLNNWSAGAGEAIVETRNGEEPYLFQVGRAGKLWRALPPRKDENGSFRYSLPFDSSAQAWRGAAFAQNHADSPFAEMARRNIHLDLASGWPGSDAGQWLAYPDSPFPLAVTLRNAGATTLTAGTAKTWAPEGWGHSEARLFERLEPGRSATATLTVRPDPRAPLGLAVPVFVWATFTPENASAPTRFQNNADFLLTPPLAVRFSFGRRGEMTLHLQSRFPGRPMSGAATLRPAEGRTATAESVPFRLDRSADLAISQKLPDRETPALRRTYATLTVGAYRQLASALDMATIDLGAETAEGGIEAVRAEDGLTEPAQATIDGKTRPVRKAIPNEAGKPHYLYFKASDSLPPAGDSYVQVEYLDQGPGSLTLQYDSTDASATLEGRYKNAEAVALGNSGVWKTFTWRISDARFDHRQNGGADFRIAMGPETVVFRRVTVSKWPIPSF
jgi:hypothetical protein